MIEETSCSRGAGIVGLEYLLQSSGYIIERGKETPEGLTLSQKGPQRA